MMKCSQYQEKFWDYYDGTLTAKEAAELEKHCLLYTSQQNCWRSLPKKQNEVKRYVILYICKRFGKNLL